MVDNSIIGQNISFLRKAKGLTQQELAGVINYSDKVISKWERGESLPDINALTNLASFFDVPMEQLVTERFQKEDTVEEKPITENRLSKYRLPLIFLHIILMLFTLSQFSRVIAIVFNIGNYNSFDADWTMQMTGVISGLIALTAIIDVILVNLKVNRIANVIAFFIVISFSIIILIALNFAYGAVDEDIIQTPVIKQGFACMALFIVGYMLEPVNKERKATLYSVDRNKKYNIVLACTIIVCSVFLFIFLAFPFYRLTYIVDQEALNNTTSIVMPSLNYSYIDQYLFIESPDPWWEGEIVNPQLEIPPTQHSFYNLVSGSPLFILVIVLLTLIALWDIISFVVHCVYKQKGNAFKVLRAKASGIVTLISASVFVVVFSLSQILMFVNSTKSNFMEIKAQALWGLFLTMVIVLALTAIKILTAINLIADNNKRIN